MIGRPPVRAFQHRFSVTGEMAVRRYHTGRHHGCRLQSSIISPTVHSRQGGASRAGSNCLLLWALIGSSGVLVEAEGPNRDDAAVATGECDVVSSIAQYFRHRIRVASSVRIFQFDAHGTVSLRPETELTVHSRGQDSTIAQMSYTMEELKPSYGYLKNVLLSPFGLHLVTQSV